MKVANAVRDGFTVEMVHTGTWEVVVENYTADDKAGADARRAELKAIGYVPFSEIY